MKRHDSNIDRLVENLRKDQSDAGIGPSIQAFSPVPVAPGRNTRKAWAWRTAALVGCASLIAVGALYPLRSSAAASFERLIASQKQSPVMFHVQPYWVDKDGATPKIWSGYVMGNRWHYVQDNFEQAFDGVRTTTYQHFSGDPVVTTESGSEHGMGEALKAAFLDGWTTKSVKDLNLEHNVIWRGRKVDKYWRHFAFVDERGTPRVGVSTLYADPVRNLPLYFEDIYSPTKGNALVWQYIEPADEDLMRIKFPASVPVRDITGQRQSSPLGSPMKAKSQG